MTLDNVRILACFNSIHSILLLNSWSLNDVFMFQWWLIYSFVQTVGADGGCLCGTIAGWMDDTNGPAGPACLCLTRSQESDSRQSSEPGPGVQSVRRHQQRQTLRHLRLQRLQRLLQTQREEEAHLQVRARFTCQVHSGKSRQLVSFLYRTNRTRIFF